MTTPQQQDDRYFRICGLTVAAGFDLPGALRVQAPDHEPDACVRRGQVPSHLPDAIQSGPAWQLTKDRILLDVPGVARFLMTQGRQVDFEPAAGQTDRDLAIFLMGSAMGALLHQRGSFVLHGSSVVVDGGAVVFLGPSGSGKSSLAATLSTSGRGLLSEDVCVIRFDGHNRPLVVPDGRMLKLWSDAVGRLGFSGSRGPAVREGIEKYWIAPPTAAPAEPVPLRALYFLKEARPPHELEIQPLGLLNAIERLRANAYRPRLVGAFGQEGAWLATSMEVMRHAKAYELRRPLSYDSLGECLQALENHWHEGKV